MIGMHLTLVMLQQSSSLAKSLPGDTARGHTGTTKKEESEENKKLRRHKYNAYMDFDASQWFIHGLIEGSNKKDNFGTR